MKKDFYTRVLQMSLLLIIIWPVTAGGMQNKSYYHRSADRLFWFMVISDIHIGAAGSQDTDYLTWAVNDARNIIDPQFIVATGDLTDATNGGTIPDKQFSEEWEVYRQILDAAGMHAGIYYDIPGNHDAYRDEDFAYYLYYSIQGTAHGTTQHSWTREFPYGKYHFLGIATAGNDGAEFSIWPWDNFGDHAELTPGEIAFLETALLAQPDAEMTFMFGHHPFEADADDWTETAIQDGLDDLQDLIDSYGVSLYGYGHTHTYMEDIWTKDIVSEIFYINTDSLGKSNQDHYTVMAVDGNGVSMVPARKGLWPVVLITAPTDRFLWQPPDEVFNPYAYEIPPGKANPIRAAVFSANPVSWVKFQIDGSATWQDMQQVGQTPVWVGYWDASEAAAGPHTVTVQAQGAATVSHQIQTYISPALCLADYDHDGDIDGLDFRAFLIEAGRTDCTLENSCDWDFDASGDVGGSDINIFAAEFGKANCP
jgi:hypothetical protein